MTREEAIKLIEHISIAFMPTDQYGDYDDPRPYEEALDMAIEVLSEVRCNDCKWSDDVIEVVRCKDCRHRKKVGTSYYCELDEFNVKDADFCSWGERKEEVNGFKSVGQAWNTSKERWEP